MHINISYDTTLASAPVGFTTAVQSAVRFFNTTLLNNITVNLTFSWAAISGLGQSLTYYGSQTYAATRTALQSHASSADSVASAATLPSTNPLPASSISMTLAEEKALGFLGASTTEKDATITLSSSSTFTFDPNNRSVSGSYDAIGVLEHEISETLGRAAGSDNSLSSTPLALFRYSAPGVRNTSSSYSGTYFSVDGQHLLYEMGEKGSDLADWGSSVKNDAFGYGSLGSAQTVSATDLRVMDVLGYQVFDAYNYEASYVDLIRAFGTNVTAASNHWYSSGFDEGRATSFDGLDYIASYKDLITAFGVNEDAGAMHYISNGFAEGRKSSFNGLEYIAQYTDLMKAFGPDEQAGAIHYIQSGNSEGRKSGFDALDYTASNTSLIASFGTSVAKAATQYINDYNTNGVLDKITFDGLAYIASYRDLINAFGANERAGATHFISSGYGEGRKTLFNAATYLSKYSDLKAAFGPTVTANNLVAIETHFIQFGAAEGRSYT